MCGFFSKNERKKAIEDNNKFRAKRLRFLILSLASYYRDFTFSAAARRISNEFNIPESTVRWNLRKLREEGLIVCGDSSNRYMPLKLTEKGKRVLKVD